MLARPSRIDEACRELEAAGGSIVHPPRDGGIPGLRLAEVTDPDDNRIQLGNHPGDGRGWPEGAAS